MPTMQRQMESLVKAVELMREGQEDNADSDDDEDDEQGEDRDSTSSRGTLLVTTRTTCDITRRDRRHNNGRLGPNNGVLISLERASVFSYDG